MWVKPPSGATQNLGAMMLDKNLEGTLETVTPHRAFMLMVTPESGPEVAEPAHDPVFSSEVVRHD